MRRQVFTAVSLMVVAAIAVVAPAFAQRRIIGAEPEAAPDAGPPPAAPETNDPKKKDKKGGDKKADDKKADDKKADKKADDKKADDTSEKKARDVLEDTAAEKKLHDEADAKKKAAEQAADAAAEADKKKKDDAQKKLVEEKKATDQKKRLENRDARLASAKRIRQITRSAGRIGLSFAIERGEVTVGNSVEIRCSASKKLEQADPRYGNLEPLKGMNVVVTVEEPSRKSSRYVVHALDAPGQYGFHFTPTKAGPHKITVVATGKDATTHFDGSFTLHVGIWPPPDFDDEEKNNVAAAADGTSSAGRKLVGGGN